MKSIGNIIRTRRTWELIWYYNDPEEVEILIYRLKEILEQIKTKDG